MKPRLLLLGLLAALGLAAVAAALTYVLGSGPETFGDRRRRKRRFEERLSDAVKPGGGHLTSADVEFI